MSERVIYVCDICNKDLSPPENRVRVGTLFRIQFGPLCVDVCKSCASTKSLKEIALLNGKWPENWGA